MVRAPSRSNGADRHRDYAALQAAGWRASSTLYVAGPVRRCWACMAWAERKGLSRHWLGPIFLFATVMIYAGIGIYGRTTDPEEYYVAGPPHPADVQRHGHRRRLDERGLVHQPGRRPVPAGLLGIGAQPGGLAYVLGWTGGFCLVALLLAPYLRKLGLYTVPDYFAARYGGRWPRRASRRCRRSCARSPTWWRRSTASA